LEHTINLNISIADEQHRLTPPRHQLFTPSVLQSVLVHMVLLAMLVFSGIQLSQRGQLPESTAKAIKAHLYFPPLPAPKVTVSKPNEAPVHTEASPPETSPSMPIESPPPQADKSSSDASSEASVVPSTAPLAEVTEASVSPSETRLQETSEALPQSAPTSTGKSMLQLNRALTSHLQKLNSNALGSLTQQAVQNRVQHFYERQTAGLDIQEPVPIEMKKVHVDCTKTSGSLLRTVSGIMGGNIRCDDNSVFQQYIDARLSKGQNNQ